MRSPKATAEGKDAFRALLPDDERVTVKPMFGSLAAFVNGHMFMGLYGDELFVRLDEADASALAERGGGHVEPMPGRPMRGYVTVPGWRTDASDARSWCRRALGYTLTLPPKSG